MKSLFSFSLLSAALFWSEPSIAQQPRMQAPKPPEISRDLETLPAPVRRMRSLLLEAFRSGELQSLKQPIETNEMPPSFTRNSARTAVKAPTMANELIKLFAERSGDGQGRETMGQLTNAFAVGHARINAGSVQEMFVWPYFAVLDPRLLNVQQEVDVYRLHSAYALREWREKGRYPGWRIGIAPDGTWHYLHGAE
jgi:hypothetical protein